MEGIYPPEFGWGLNPIHTTFLWKGLQMMVHQIYELSKVMLKRMLYWRNDSLGHISFICLYISKCLNVQVELMFRCSKTKNAFVAWKRVIYNKTKTYYAPQLQNICRILLPHAVFMHFSQFNSWGLDHHFLFGGTLHFGFQGPPLFKSTPISQRKILTKITQWIQVLRIQFVLKKRINPIVRSLKYHPKHPTVFFLWERSYDRKFLGP